MTHTQMGYIPLARFHCFASRPSKESQETRVLARHGPDTAKHFGQAWAGARLGVVQVDELEGGSEGAHDAGLAHGAHNFNAAPGCPGAAPAAPRRAPLRGVQQRPHYLHERLHLRPRQCVSVQQESSRGPDSAVQAWPAGKVATDRFLVSQRYAVINQNLCLCAGNGMWSRLPEDAA